MSRLRPWRLLTLAAVVATGVAALGWTVVSRPLAPPTIEEARVLSPSELDGPPEPAALATPRRIEVRFTTESDLAQLRGDRGFGAISVVLSACGESAWVAEQVIAQRADYLADRGRVRRLGTAGPDRRTRYQAVFDDRLTRLADHVFQNEPALGRPGGLCLTLRGDGLGLRGISSAPVRLPRML